MERKGIERTGCGRDGGMKVYTTVDGVEREVRSRQVRRKKETGEGGGD